MSKSTSFEILPSPSLSDPDSLLSYGYSSFKFCSKQMLSGRFTDKSFPLMDRCFREEQLPKFPGISPEKKLLDSLNTWSRGKEEQINVFIGPSKWLLLKSMTSKFWRWNKLSGREPVKKLWERFKTLSWSKPAKDSQILLLSLLLPSSKRITLVPTHVTPDQVQ